MDPLLYLTYVGNQRVYSIALPNMCISGLEKWVGLGVQVYRNPADTHLPLVKSAYQKLIFLFLNQNICCGYSNKPF